MTSPVSDTGVATGIAVERATNAQEEAENATVIAEEATAVSESAIQAVDNVAEVAYATRNDMESLQSQLSQLAGTVSEFISTVSASHETETEPAPPKVHKETTNPVTEESGKEKAKREYGSSTWFGDM